jgi:hypothetical protein
MSKKRDPLVAVIQYFNTVDLVAAGTALTVVREIVRSRQPRLAADSVPKKKKPAVRKTAPVAEPALAPVS